MKKSNRFWWIWKGRVGRGMWPLRAKVPKHAMGPFKTEPEAKAFSKARRMFVFETDKPKRSAKSHRRNPEKEYKLGSSDLVYAPGLIRWAKNGYKTSRGKQRNAFIEIITGTWGIPKQVAIGLLMGAYQTHVEGEALVFEAPQEFRMLFNRRRR